MRKNTAGLVALGVLAVATLLMIFVVLPNVGDKTAADGTLSAPAGSGDTTTTEAKGNRPMAGAAENPSDAASKAAPSAQPNPTAGQSADQATTAPSTPVPPTAASSPPGLSSPDPSPTRPSNTSPGAASDAPAGQASAGETPATPAGTADGSGTPSFDVLRVEPDGSTVIAGRAEPNSKLEIVNGNAVVGTADVGGTGDFAAVFDKPLPPGDYQLTLRSTNPSGAVTASDEVATVSIPNAENGQLLAMVTKPGEASRILTAPRELTAPASGPAGSADVAPAGNNQAALQTPAQTPAPVPGNAAPAPSSAPQGAPTSPVSVSAVEIEGRKLFVAGTARPNAAVRVYADDQLVGEGKADAQGRFVIDGELALSVGQHVIRVDMVGADGKVQMRSAVPFERPEGDQISAVAQTPASGSDPAFDGAIFDASRMEAAKAFALLKGLFADGKLPGLDQLAAARSATEIALTSLAGVKPVAGMQTSVTDRVNATTKAAGEALAILKPLPRNAAAVGAALGRLDTAMSRVLETSPAVATNGASGASAPASSSQTTVAGQSATGQSATDPKPTDPSNPGPSAPETAAGTPPTTPGDTVPSQSATAPSSQTVSGEPETIRQAPLQQSKSSVIIRRGDTLWQISRRVYGAGVRYTTIYVANEDQIIDPDRILPGQVFGVPDTALPDAQSQEIHRRHMRHMP